MKTTILGFVVAVMCGGGAFASSVALDGVWDFKYFKDRKAWEQGGGEWMKMPVPSNWEMHGVGTFGYGSNRGKPSEECGLYRTAFATPEGFKPGCHAFLRFEGVMFGAEVKVNGEVAGSFRSSFNRNVIEVTELLNAAGEENTLEVRTGIRPKGAEFDTNDDWTLHGIFRSVWLDVRPAVHLKDWTVTTKLNGDGTASVAVKTELEGEGTVEHNLPETVGADGLWSAERPVLHDVVFTVRDATGRVTEEVRAKVGLREVTWDGGELRVNGERVWLKGVNHHDLCPCHGRAITDEEQWRDARMIKDAGMDFIRCAHYPPSAALLDACDALGIYVMDEVPCGFAWYLVQDAAYGEVLDERVRLTIARDRNRPSVLLWSVGNENPATQVKLDAGRLAGELDPTRPWTLPMTPGTFKEWMAREDRTGAPPVYDWHYPNADDIPDYTNNVDRPIIASEWGHAFGSDAGAVEDIYKAMQAWPQCAGGAVWIFQDQGVERKAADCGRDALVASAWKDAETLWDSHGIAGTDGLVYSDRTPQTAWYQICALFNKEKRHLAASSQAKRLEAASPCCAAEAAPPLFQLRFDRRMTITKRTAIESAKAAAGKKKLGKRDAPPKNLVSPRVQAATANEVSVTPTNGAYLVRYSFSRDAAWDSSEAGVCFELPPEFRTFRWHGMGPYEAYPKRDALDSIGEWALDKDDLYFPGNRLGVTEAVVCDGSGAGWMVTPVERDGSLNIAVEDGTAGGIRLCVNAFVCEPYRKRNWPRDMRHVEAGEKIEGAFLLAPVATSGETPLPPDPFKPFFRNYDRGEGEL